MVSHAERHLGRVGSRGEDTAKGVWGGLEEWRGNKWSIVKERKPREIDNLRLGKTRGKKKAWKVGEPGVGG